MKSCSGSLIEDTNGLTSLAMGLPEENCSRSGCRAHSLALASMLCQHIMQGCRLLDE